MAIYLFVDKSKNEFSLAPAVARIDDLDFDEDDEEELETEQEDDNL